MIYPVVRFVSVWADFGSFFSPFRIVSVIFRIATASGAVPFFVSSGVSEVGIASGFVGGSSNTGFGADSSLLGSQPSMSVIAWKNCLTHVSHGNGGSADTFPQYFGTLNKSVLSCDCTTEGCAMRKIKNYKINLLSSL